MFEFEHLHILQNWRNGLRRFGNHYDYESIHVIQCQIHLLSGKTVGGEYRWHQIRAWPFTFLLATSKATWICVFKTLHNMLVYVGLGMFRSWDGWNFKLWFQFFFCFFSNFSFNLYSSDPCCSCSFRPPTPRLISATTLMSWMVDKPHPTHSLSHFTKGWSAWLFWRPRFQSTLYSFSVFQWYGHSAHFARGIFKTYAEFVGHAGATRKMWRWS